MTSVRGNHLRPERNRLDVLRGLISDVTNAAKTSKPITTDAQMLKIIQKRVKSSEAAVEEFQSAKRDDLKDREVAQIAILEAYIDSDSMGEDDITRAIQDVIGKLRSEEKTVNQGSVMKSLVGPGGTLEDQLVDKQVIVKLVKGKLHFLSCCVSAPLCNLSCETCHRSEGLPGPVSRTKFHAKRDILTSKSFRHVMKMTWSLKAPLYYGWSPTYIVTIAETSDRALRFGVRPIVWQ